MYIVQTERQSKEATLISHEGTIYGYHGEKPEGKRPLGRPTGKIILKWIFKKWDGRMDWIELAQNRDRWRALVNAVMKLMFP